jgi:hypothetical protein
MRDQSSPRSSTHTRLPALHLSRGGLGWSRPKLSRGVKRVQKVQATSQLVWQKAQPWRSRRVDDSLLQREGLNTLATGVSYLPCHCYKTTYLVDDPLVRKYQYLSAELPHLRRMEQAPGVVRCSLPWQRHFWSAHRKQCQI